MFIARCGIAVLLLGTAAQANLITNGGFESGAGLQGWTAGGGNLYDPTAITNDPVVPPRSGVWAVDLGPSGFASENGGFLSQTVAVAAGSYVLNFWHRTEFDGLSSPFRLDLTGAATLTANLLSSDTYQLYTVHVNAAAGDLTITFTDTQSAGEFNTLIDDVSLSTSAVPEPATGLMILSCLGAAAWVRRKRFLQRG